MKRVQHMSASARRVMRPLLAVVVVTFLSFLVHAMMLGTSAFSGGHVVDGRYLVEEHGKVIELTAGQYWASYVHGVVVVLVFGVAAVLILVFYSRGDLRDEYVGS